MMKLIANQKKWNKEKWIKVVNCNDFLIPLHEHYNSKNEVYDSAVLKIDGVVYGEIAWNWESKDCTVEVEIKYLTKVYEALESVASDLGGKFYIRKNEIFDPKRHLPAPAVEINRSQQYFDSNELENIRWLGFREENKDELLKALKLEGGKSGLLTELLNSGECEKFIITPPYQGWTFIIGNNLPDLLINGDENSTEEALTNLCKAIQKLSKRFIEVQYYEHNEKSNITGYFKTTNGKLIFGFWKSETEEFSKGRVPKDIKKFHPTSAHEIASLWSVDPSDFGYIKEFLNKTSLDARLKK